MRPESRGNIVGTYPSIHLAAESDGIERALVSKSCRGHDNEFSDFWWRFEDQLGTLDFPVTVPVVSSLPSLPAHLVPRVEPVEVHSPPVPPEAVTEFVVLSHRVTGNDVEFLVRYRNSQMWVEMHDVISQARCPFNSYMAKLKQRPVW